jgi:hypothetical protein
MFTSGPHDSGPFGGGDGSFPGGNGFGGTPFSGGMSGSNGGFDHDPFGLESLDLRDLVSTDHVAVDVGLHFHGAIREMHK